MKISREQYDQDMRLAYQRGLNYATANYVCLWVTNPEGTEKRHWLQLGDTLTLGLKVELEVDGVAAEKSGNYVVSLMKQQLPE